MNRLLTIVAVVAAVALASVSFVDGFSLVFMTSDYYKRNAKGPKRNAAFYEEAAKKGSETLERQLARQAENRKRKGIPEPKRAEKKIVLKLSPEERKQKLEDTKKAKRVAAALALEEKKKKKKEKAKRVLAMKAEKVKKIKEQKLESQKKLAEKKAAAAAAKEEKQRKRIGANAKKVTANKEKQKKNKDNKTSKVVTTQTKTEVDDTATIETNRSIFENIMAKMKGGGGGGGGTGSSSSDKPKKKNVVATQAEKDADDIAAVEANRKMIENIMAQKKNKK